jgi:small subunit ribosomal protein SAe
MTEGLKVLDATEDDIQRLIAAKTHMGTKNLTKEMEKYIYGKTKEGIHIINMSMMWQKLMLAARIIVAIENPQDVMVIAQRPYGQRAVLKFGNHIGCNYIAGRWTPGLLTNQIQKKFMQPRLLIVTDPRTDLQAVKEASYVNIPVIAFCDTDSPLENVDVCIPCNNRGRQAIGMMYWLLAREVLRMRGVVLREVPWDEPVDLFFYMDPEEVVKKEEQNVAPAANVIEDAALTAGGDAGAWPETAPDISANWANEVVAGANIDWGQG